MSKGESLYLHVEPAKSANRVLLNANSTAPASYTYTHDNAKFFDEFICV